MQCADRAHHDIAVACSLPNGFKRQSKKPRGAPSDCQEWLLVNVIPSTQWNRTVCFCLLLILFCYFSLCVSQCWSGLPTCWSNIALDEHYSCSLIGKWPIHFSTPEALACSHTGPSLLGGREREGLKQLIIDCWTHWICQIHSLRFHSVPFFSQFVLASVHLPFLPQNLSLYWPSIILIN